MTGGVLSSLNNALASGAKGKGGVLEVGLENLILIWMQQSIIMV